jgi:hypothetical protein
LNNFDEAFVIGLVHFLDGLAEFVRAHGDGRAMRVGAGDHQHFVPLQAVIACDNVTG